MKNLIISLIACFLCLMAIAQENIPVIWPVTSNYAFDAEFEKHYLLADNVSLRNGASEDSKVMTTIPIGTALTFYEVSTKTYVSNGIESAWYKTKYNGKTGWIWGGLVANHAFGSNADPSIKFLGGTAGLKWDEEFASHRRTYQIRAIQNGKEIDRIELMTFGQAFAQLRNLGNQGLDINDILYLGVPCDEGCGCSTGEIVVFWDGKKFHHVTNLESVADGDYGTHVGFIFPTEMEGREGMIVKRVSDYDDSQEMYDRGVILRYVEDSYWVWNGQDLLNTGMPVKRVEAEVEVEY